MKFLQIRVQAHLIRDSGRWCHRSNASSFRKPSLILQDRADPPPRSHSIYFSEWSHSYGKGQLFPYYPSPWLSCGHENSRGGHNPLMWPSMHGQSHGHRCAQPQSLICMSTYLHLLLKTITLRDTVPRITFRLSVMYPFPSTYTLCRQAQATYRQSLCLHRPLFPGQSPPLPLVFYVS